MRRFHGREIFDSKIEKPFRMIIGGGSGTGKTSFTQKLVNANHFSSPTNVSSKWAASTIIPRKLGVEDIIKPSLHIVEFSSNIHLH